MGLREILGIWRSKAMYYWKPLNKRRLVRFYRQFITPGDLCFDIGAHLGNRTDAWLAIGAHVIAVEPQQACLQYLQRKFGGSDSVVIVPKAVGEREGLGKLHVSRLTPTISTLSDEDWRAQINSDAWYEVKWEDKVDVPITTLDALIAEYGEPAFCKIDVENFEVQVLRGLSRPIRRLSFEYYPPFTDSAVNCIDLLDQLGNYAYNWSFGESQKLEREAWISSEEMRHIVSGFTNRKEYGDIYAALM